MSGKPAATRPLSLGGRIFAVPPLPLGHNIEAYPLLKKLHNNGFLERWLSEGEPPTEADMADLATVLFICAKAADPGLTVEAFHALPVTPAELFAGWAVARYQSGGWVPAPEGAHPGEKKGEPKPPKSTSAASSPS